MKRSCYIIDDELHAVELLRSFVEQTPELTLAGWSTRPLQALAEIAALQPDICFIDIDMPELSGLTLAERIGRQSIRILTTAFREFGPEAFECEVADYLLKPLSYERFLQSLAKIHKPAEILFVKTGLKGVLQPVPVNDIRYVSGLSAYVELHLRSAKVITQQSLNGLLAQLPPAAFSRIHKSYIVADAAVRLVKGGYVLLDGGLQLPIGRVYRRAFLQKLEQFKKL